MSKLASPDGGKVSVDVPEVSTDSHNAVVEPGGRPCRKCKAASARDLCDRCFTEGVAFAHAHPDYTPERKP
jgi:hypothetical protein